MTIFFVSIKIHDFSVRNSCAYLKA